MKLPYFGLNLRLLLQIYFGSGFESGFESGSKKLISVPDRIRPKVSDPYGSGSGSGSATLPELPIGIQEANKLWIHTDSDPTWTLRCQLKNMLANRYLTVVNH